MAEDATSTISVATNATTEQLQTKRLSIVSNRLSDAESITSTQLSPSIYYQPDEVQQDAVMIEAAIKNDLVAAKKLIALNIDLNHKSQMGRAPIHWAIIYGYPEFVSLLIEAKCDIELADIHGMRPILMAALVGNVTIAKMLISAGCDCNVYNKKQQSVLHIAIRHNQNELINFLVDQVPDLALNAVNDSSQTALIMATIGRNLEVVSKLVNAGADLNLKDKLGRTAAHWAAFKGFVDVLKCLLKAGSNPDIRDQNGKTALHYTAEYGFWKTAKLLIEHNCDIAAIDMKKRSALMVAAAVGNIEVVETLVNAGCNPNYKDRNGNTALHLSVMGNHAQIAEYLIQHRADINALNQRRQTPLVAAAEMGHTEVAAILIRHKADLFATEKSGRTALYIASRGSFQALVDMLIKAERDHFFKRYNHQHGHHRRHHHTRQKSLSCKANSRLPSTTTKTTTFDDTDAGTDVNISTDLDDSQCSSDDDPDDYDQMDEVYEKEPAIVDSIQMGHMRKLLYYLSHTHLDSNDWKKLARFWDFTEDQIKAIEHQYTGKTSYKDHAYRMLLIWLHGQPPEKNPVTEIYDALIYIDKLEVAEKMRKRAEEGRLGDGSDLRRLNCRCLPTIRLPAIPSGMCHYCCII